MYHGKGGWEAGGITGGTATDRSGCNASLWLHGVASYLRAQLGIHLGPRPKILGYGSPQLDRALPVLGIHLQRCAGQKGAEFPHQRKERPWGAAGPDMPGVGTSAIMRDTAGGTPSPADA